jgi:hypothetical protein
MSAGGWNIYGREREWFESEIEVWYLDHGTTGTRQSDRDLGDGGIYRTVLNNKLQTSK